MSVLPYVRPSFRTYVRTYVRTRDMRRFEFGSDDSGSIWKWWADSKFANRPHLPSYHKLLSLFNKNFNCCAILIEIYFMFMIFSQTWLCYVWLMLWKIRPSVVCDMRHPTQGRFNFSGIFLHHSVAIQQLTHQKSRRSSKGITSSEQISLTGVWLWDSSKIAK